MKNNNFMNDISQIAQAIPEGFSFVEGTVSTGLVIQDQLGNRYVRIPAGTNTEGVYVRDFWVSQYEISEGENETPQSMAGKAPWVRISYEKAVKIASKVGGFIISREEYSRICTWLVDTGAVSYWQMYKDGKGMGNYDGEFSLMKTGSNPDWACNKIFDFFGNGYIWTTERYEVYEHHRIIKGGNRKERDTGYCYPPVNRAWEDPSIGRSNLTFRIVLHDEVEDED